MARKYFTLVAQEPGQDWAPLFGDFDREVVAQEMADTRDSFDFVRRTMLRIVVSAPEQAAIDAAVAELNAPRVRHFSMSARTEENPLGEYFPKR